MTAALFDLGPSVDVTVNGFGDVQISGDLQYPGQPLDDVTVTITPSRVALVALGIELRLATVSDPFILPQSDGVVLQRNDYDFSDEPITGEVFIDAEYVPALIGGLKQHAAKTPAARNAYAAAQDKIAELLGGHANSITHDGREFLLSTYDGDTALYTIPGWDPTVWNGRDRWIMRHPDGSVEYCGCPKPENAAQPQYWSAPKHTRNWTYVR